ncbi:HAD family hydrolase [Embleya sp. NPDC008237]|uniref:HAD family hydrolase n=1 Tax=Embleya sp. NPDC008237 TaxID=3363978 RepID=UPI0036EB374C
MTDDMVAELTFVGFVGPADPVRTGAAPAAARLRDAGVRIVMLTGDHPATADAIAATVNGVHEQNSCTGAELDELDDDGLEMTLRAATTTLGAGLARSAARVTGRRRRSGTIALAALVGTQLGQTLTTGPRTATS